VPFAVIPSISDAAAEAPHVPVLLAEVLSALAPADGDRIVDGTFGAGGYSRAILASSRCNVIAFDRDPDAIAAGQSLVVQEAGRLTLVQDRFSAMDSHVEGQVQGIVLDIGVSSMQLDEAARGFSFLRDGPLDMRMSQAGPSAADIANSYGSEALADLIFVFGEEPRSRAIARAIVKAREEAPLATTLDLVRAVERATGPQRAKDRTHPATRTFQALRIFVNSEFEELAEALFAAERMLAPGGRLVVVSFHSLEDRIVKKFFAERSGNVPTGSRHQPQTHALPDPSFHLPVKGHIAAGEAEVARNPRSRSAKLRCGIRTAAAAHRADTAEIGVPQLPARSH
jgi:16S rRNA (cytosine1402-N4)-methyltransferase